MPKIEKLKKFRVFFRERIFKRMGGDYCDKLKKMKPNMDPPSYQQMVIYNDEVVPGLGDVKERFLTNEKTGVAVFKNVIGDEEREKDFSLTTAKNGVTKIKRYLVKIRLFCLLSPEESRCSSQN